MKSKLSQFVQWMDNWLGYIGRKKKHEWVNQNKSRRESMHAVFKEKDGDLRQIYGVDANVGEN